MARYISICILIFACSAIIVFFPLLAILQDLVISCLIIIIALLCIVVTLLIKINESFKKQKR